MTEWSKEVWKAEWQRRSRWYKARLEAAYPEWFDWEWHSTMVIEMCKAEVELELRDEAIAADPNENSWQDNARSRTRDALFRYRRELLITPKIRSTLKQEKEEKTGFARLEPDPDLKP